MGNASGRVARAAHTGGHHPRAALPPAPPPPAPLPASKAAATPPAVAEPELKAEPAAEEAAKPLHAHLYEPGGVFAEMPAEFRAPQPRGSQHLVGQLNAQLGIERGLVNPDGSVKLMRASELAQQQASEAKEGENNRHPKVIEDSIRSMGSVVRQDVHRGVGWAHGLLRRALHATLVLERKPPDAQRIKALARGRGSQHRAWPQTLSLTARHHIPRLNTACIDPHRATYGITRAATRGGSPQSCASGRQRD